MKLVFFISQNEMLRGLFDALKKQQPIDFFTEKTIIDSLHFIEDMEPSLILIDLEGVDQTELESLKERFGSMSPIVEIGQGADIQKPINPLELLERLKTIYNSFHE